MAKDYGLKDGADEIRNRVFVVGNVLNGADSVDRLMMATYLSQFEEPEGKLAKKPIFKPDFWIGYVPYSRELGKIINKNIKNGYLRQFPYETTREKREREKGGRERKEVSLETSLDKIWMETNRGILERNRRLNEVYQRNWAILERYPSNPDMREAITKLLVKDKNLKV